jgi:hypothetical protein
VNAMPLSPTLTELTDPTRSGDDTAPNRDVPSLPSDLGTRLVLSPRPGVAASDGAWWPRTLDLLVEVPLLDAAVHELTRARIARLSYERSTWEAAPRKVRTPLGITHLGWFDNSRRPHHVLLSMSSYVRLVLTLIPPDLDEDSARGMLDSGGAGADAELLRSEARGAGDRWADDGGTKQAAHRRL